MTNTRSRQRSWVWSSCPTFSKGNKRRLNGLQAAIRVPDRARTLHFFVVSAKKRGMACNYLPFQEYLSGIQFKNRDLNKEIRVITEAWQFWAHYSERRRKN